MQNNNDQVHANPDPNPDGEKEGVINDPKAYKMGVVTGNLRAGFKFTQNPYHVGDKDATPEDMKEFEELTRGKKLDEI